MFRKKYISVLVLYLIFNSCDGVGDPGGEPVYDGFEFNIFNGTSKIINAELIIGAFVNGSFISTDSVYINDIEIGRSYPMPGFFNEDTWKPELQTIRSLSNRCYFKLKLPNKRQELLTEFESSELFILTLPKNNQFTGRFGKLFISFNEINMWGDVAERE